MDSNNINSSIHSPKPQRPPPPSADALKKAASVKAMVGNAPHDIRQASSSETEKLTSLTKPADSDVDLFGKMAKKSLKERTVTKLHNTGTAVKNKLSGLREAGKIWMQSPKETTITLGIATWQGGKDKVAHAGSAIKKGAAHGYEKTKELYSKAKAGAKVFADAPKETSKALAHSAYAGGKKKLGMAGNKLKSLKNYTVRKLPEAVPKLRKAAALAKLNLSILYEKSIHARKCEQQAPVVLISNTPIADP